LTWYLYNNKKEKAKLYFEKIMNSWYWPAFGFIAAEVELLLLKEQ
jgi:hypothetical protein